MKRVDVKSAVAGLMVVLSAAVAHAQATWNQIEPVPAPTAVDYSSDHGYGSATASDIGQQYYLRNQDSEPRYVIRSRGMATAQNAWQGYASNTMPSRQPSGLQYGGQSGTQFNGQSGSQNNPSGAREPRQVPRTQARFIAAEGDENTPPSVPKMESESGVPPMPPSAGSSSGGSEGGNSYAGRSDGNSTGCDSCGCNSCSCGSCDCDSCGDCRCHKFRPLIQIDECCPLKCDDQDVDHLFDCCWLKSNDMTITGWLNAGIMGNSRRSDDRFNGPLTFADRCAEGQANQEWISWDCSAPKDNCGWFLGGHIDYFFGSDYFFTTAAGLDGTPKGNVPRWHTDDRLLYGFAMPQLYVETDYGSDFKIKCGHFFTIIGYEVVPAIGNFFYSHAYTMQYGEPFTHTGILASESHCNWTYYGGLVAGWNTFNTNDRAAFLGGVTYADKDWGSLAFSLITGDDSESNLPGVAPFGSRTMYSLVWSRNFTSRFTYVLQHDLGIQDEAQTPSGGAQWYGINQYMFYKLNCCWSAGLRIEWFRDDDGFVVTGLRPGNAIVGASFPGNFSECTLGLNYKPNGNLAIRPEVRWDWYDGQTNRANTAATLPFDAGTRSNQFTYGLDLVYQF